MVQLLKVGRKLNKEKKKKNISRSFFYLIFLMQFHGPALSRTWRSWVHEASGLQMV